MTHSPRSSSPSTRAPSIAELEAAYQRSGNMRDLMAWSQAVARAARRNSLAVRRYLQILTPNYN
jgi:hypothetical protein